MNPLRAIVRDLVDRRMWPVAALLAVLLIAVPVLFLRPSDQGGENPVAPSAAAAAGTSAGSSPLSADKGLPAGVKSLLDGSEVTQGAVHADGALNDPFVPPAVPAPTTTTATTTAPAATATSVVGGTTAAPASTTTPGTTQTAPLSSATSTPSTATTTSTPFSLRASAAAPGTTEVVSVDVRFGRGSGAGVTKDVVRLTPFPTAHWPIALFLGVTGDRSRAAFLLAPSARISGQGTCRPADDLCNTLVLSQGQSATITVPGANGDSRSYTLAVTSIAARNAGSADAAAQIRSRVSAAGSCILHAVGGYAYDSSQGTLGANSDATSCDFASPQPAASLPALR